MKKIFLITLAFMSTLAFGQTTTTPPLPTAVSVVGEFNQLTNPNWSLGVSALYAPTAQSNLGMYNTTTADVVPVKATNPTTGKIFVALSASVRQGIHEKILSTGNFVFLLGADVGPGFSSNTTTSGINLTFTSSFVATSVYRVKPWCSIVVPIRMLYINNVGWNPVLQAGISFNLKALPPPAK